MIAPSERVGAKALRLAEEHRVVLLRDGAAIVAGINDGNLTVPTVLFGDGSTLTNPSVSQIGSRLAAA